MCERTVEVIANIPSTLLDTCAEIAGSVLPALVSLSVATKAFCRVHSAGLHYRESHLTGTYACGEGGLAVIRGMSSE